MSNDKSFLALNLCQTSVELERIFQERDIASTRQVKLEVSPHTHDDTAIKKPTVAFWMERLRSVAEKLPSGLTHLAICSLKQTHTFTRIPVRAIGEILTQHATTLRSLSFEGCIRLAGSDEDFGVFIDRIASLSRLTKFRFGDVLNDELWFCCVIHALGRITTLEEIDLSENNDILSDRSDVLWNLCNRYSSSGQERKGISLTINGDITEIPSHVLLGADSRLTRLVTSPGEGDEFLTFENVQCLRNNRILKELCVSVEDVTEGTELLSLLQNDNQTLTSLTLGIKKASAIDHAVPLGNAIRNISFLKTLTIHFYIPVADDADDYEEENLIQHADVVKEYLAALLGGVSQHRPSLSKVSFFIGSSLKKRRLRKLLREKEIADKLSFLESSLEKGENTCLTSLSLKHVDDINLSAFKGCFSKTRLYTKLNGIGFAKLKNRPDNRDLWVNKLIEQKDKTKIAFHLIQANPSVYFSTPLEGPVNGECIARIQKKRKAIAM